MQKEAIFYNKFFLIYGFGKSGYASYKFLSKKNNCKIIDDNKKNIPSQYKHKIINAKSGLGLGNFIGKTLLERMKATVKFSKYSKTNGAMVTIKWNTKDLLSI